MSTATVRRRTFQRTGTLTEDFSATTSPLPARCLRSLSEILRNYKEYSRKGYCPNYAKEAESRTYKAYHALGGNDVATDKHEHIMTLPDEIEKREEK